MNNLDNIKVVYVVIDDDTRQRRGLYIDGDLAETSQDDSVAAMEASLESGWSGLYEQLVMSGMDSLMFCEDYADMPSTLEEVIRGGRVESGTCKFPGEFD